MIKYIYSIKQIEHNLILTAIDSGIPDVIQKLVSKLGDQEKASILYDILGSSDIVKNMVVSNILLNNIAKIPDNYKYALLDLTSKGNSYGIKNFFIFNRLLEKSGPIDEEHINTYLGLLDPSDMFSIMCMGSLYNMKHLASNHNNITTVEDTIVDNLTVTGEINITPSDVNLL